MSCPANTVTGSSPVTTMEPNSWGCLEAWNADISASNQSEDLRELNIFRALSLFPTPELLMESDFSCEDAISSLCEEPLSKPELIAPRKSRVIPKPISSFSNVETNRLTQASQAADLTFKTLEQLYRLEEGVDRCLMRIQEVSLSSIEESKQLSDCSKNLEILRQKSIGTADQLGAVRRELLKVRHLMRIGKIAVTSGGMDIVDNQM